MTDHPEVYQCAWCDKQARHWRLVLRAVIRKKKGKPEVISPAEYAPVCGMHKLSLVDAAPDVERGRAAARAKSWKARQETIC